MSRNIQKFFYFYFWYNIFWALKDISVLSLFIRFDFLLVLVSLFYLIKEIVSSKLYSNNAIPRVYNIILSIVIFWVIINIFRSPPQNAYGFIRYLGGKYYLAAWFPILFVYIGSRVSFWSQIWSYATKFVNLVFWLSPLILILFVTNNIWWANIVALGFAYPILLLNWDISKRMRIKVVLVMILFVVFGLLGGSRGIALRVIYYIPALFLIFLLKRSNNKALKMAISFSFMVLLAIITNYIYTNKTSKLFSDDIGANISKFEGKGFINSRKEYVYPDFFADMNSKKDWLLGRGINGSYYSFIFVNQMLKLGLDEKNSLGVKAGFRTEIESGYLFVILKIGLFGLLLILLLAISALYLGLFKSKNWFTRSCALIILEWLIFMYPAGLPEYHISYVLFWLCIGACLSKETRNSTSSLYFIRNAATIQGKNDSFTNINRF